MQNDPLPAAFRAVSRRSLSFFGTCGLIHYLLITKESALIVLV